jgi:uroporphyrinogen III methyltransferase/synthase
MAGKKGKVYLVGAGPGDIGLLTVKGKRCLERADVVVYDFHLNAQVLNYINHEAEFIYAGKRGGRHALGQEEINAILVARAKAGKVVTRLKGGDPFVFGRGGEEAEALAAEGLQYEVVPGVSSAVAAPAYAGIPLTHRKYSSSFAVIPGYEDITKEDSAIDWAKLAAGVGTIVFLMAVKNIEVVTKKLIEHGRSPDTPVAIVRWGTRADQTTLTSNLSDVAAQVKEKEIKPPAVVVVGDVVRLRETLKWYELKPMFGTRILVTREHTGGFEALEDLGAEVIEFPTIEVVPPGDWGPMDTAINGIVRGDRVPHWLVFTSANGVKYFFTRYLDLGHDIRDLKGIKVCAIGKKTAEEAGKFGIRVDLMPEKFRAEGLVEAFLKDLGGDLKGTRFLLPRAEVAREVFPDAIRAAGGEIDVPVAYRAVIPATRGKRLRRFLREGRISVATFTSAATFSNFREILGPEADELLRDVAIAAIGPVTAEAIKQGGLKVDIMPSEATVEAMVEAIKKHILKTS